MLESAEKSDYRFDVKRLKARDPEEWRKFLIAMRPIALKNIAKMLHYDANDMDDAYANAVKAAYEKAIDTYDPKKYNKISDWFVVIARNWALVIIQKNKMFQKYALIETESRPAGPVEPDYLSDTLRDSKKILHVALAKFTRRQREVFEIVLDSDDATLQELGDQLGVEREAVRQIVEKIIGHIDASRSEMEKIPDPVEADVEPFSEPDLIPEPEAPKPETKSKTAYDKYEKFLTDLYSAADLQKKWRLLKVPFWFSFRISAKNTACIVHGEEAKNLIENGHVTPGKYKIILRMDNFMFKYICADPSDIKRLKSH